MPDDPKPDDKTYDQAYVTRLRNEIAELRTERETLVKERDELKTFKDATERAESERKGEYEKARAQLEKEKRELEARAKEERAASDRRFIVAEAKAAALKKGIIDPSDVETLDFADLAADDAELAAKIEAKIDAAKTQKAHWFKAEGADPQPRPRPGASPGAVGAFGGGDTPPDFSKMSDVDLDSYIASRINQYATP